MAARHQNLGGTRNSSAGSEGATLKRAESALTTLAQIIVDHPQFEAELLLLFERLESEIDRLKTRDAKLNAVRQLAARAARDNQSRA